MWINKTPVPIDMDMHMRKTPLFLGLEYSPMRSGHSVPAMPAAMPWRDLAARSRGRLLERAMLVHPPMERMMLMMFPIFLPNLPMMKGMVRLPNTKVIAGIDAEKKDNSLLVIKRSNKIAM